MSGSRQHLTQPSATSAIDPALRYVPGARRSAPGEPARAL